MASWGFALTRKGLCEVIQQYLNRTGRKTRFADNLPAREFVRGFLNRHQELSVRMSKPIKRGRAQLSPDVIRDFFEKVCVVLENVPPENIINYDETNLQNNPGVEASLYKKGVKYAEHVIEHGKDCFTVMFAGSAAGELLPPYIVYKSKYVSDNWISGGPPGTRFHASSSGWMDGFLFADWFKTVALPFLKKRSGKKVLIGK